MHLLSIKVNHLSHSSNDLSGPEDGECDSADEAGEGGRKSAELRPSKSHFRGGRIVPLPPPPPVALFTSQNEDRGDFEAKAKGGIFLRFFVLRGGWAVVGILLR